MAEAGSYAMRKGEKKEGGMAQYSGRRCAMSEHQPLPWTVSADGDLVDAEGIVLRMVGAALPWPPDDPVACANRDLIARSVTELSGARQALQEMEDAHSEECGARLRAEDERDRLRKILASIEDAHRLRQDVEDMRTELIRVEAQRDALGKALQLAARHLAELPHEASGRLALIQEAMDNALRTAGLLPEEES